MGSKFQSPLAAVMIIVYSTMLPASRATPSPNEEARLRREATAKVSAAAALLNPRKSLYEQKGSLAYAESLSNYLTSEDRRALHKRLGVFPLLPTYEVGESVTILRFTDNSSDSFDTLELSRGRFRMGGVNYRMRFEKSLEENLRQWENLHPSAKSGLSTSPGHFGGVLRKLDFFPSAYAARTPLSGSSRTGLWIGLGILAVVLGAIFLPKMRNQRLSEAEALPALPPRESREDLTAEGLRLTPRQVQQLLTDSDHHETGGDASADEATAPSADDFLPPAAPEEAPAAGQSEAPAPLTAAPVAAKDTSLLTQTPNPQAAPALSPADQAIVAFLESHHLGPEYIKELREKGLALTSAERFEYQSRVEKMIGTLRDEGDRLKVFWHRLFSQVEIEGALPDSEVIQKFRADLASLPK